MVRKQQYTRFFVKSKDLVEYLKLAPRLYEASIYPARNLVKFKLRFKEDDVWYETGFLSYTFQMCLLLDGDGNVKNEHECFMIGGNNNE